MTEPIDSSPKPRCSIDEDVQRAELAKIRQENRDLASALNQAKRDIERLESESRQLNGKLESQQSIVEFAERQLRDFQEISQRSSEFLIEECGALRRENHGLHEYIRGIEFSMSLLTPKHIESE